MIKGVYFKRDQTLRTYALLQKADMIVVITWLAINGYAMKSV